MQFTGLVMVVVLLLGTAWWLDGTPAALLLVGALLGLTLFHGRFGFTAAYRRLLAHGEVDLILAQIAMLAVATILFALLFSLAGGNHQQIYPAAAPIALHGLVGAFLFGIGMQLAGGCGSGCLYAAGGGSPRMGLVLLAFCGGSFWASLHMGWWQSMPGYPAVVLGERLGWMHGAMLQLILLGGLAAICLRWGRRTPPAGALGPGWQRLWRGPWPLLVAALLLALFNAVTLVLAGHPWTITWAFSLCGAKVATWMGWDPAGSPFWSAPFQQAALQGSLLADTTSVMNIGLVLGAAIAALSAGLYRPVWRSPPQDWLSALLGGVLLGYGARIAFGCNIGAFFSGVASTSLHGWVWIAAALPGNWVGMQLRPLFGMDRDH